MKRLLACLLICAPWASLAFAADAPKPAPKPTIESLQAQIATDEKTIMRLGVLYQGAMTQRDAAQKALNDAQLQDYATQQMEAQKPKP